MKSSDLPYKSKPGYIPIAIGMLGLLLFGFLSNLVYTTKNFHAGIKQLTDNLIIYVILDFFLFFGLGCFWMVIGMQLYLITETELIITRPLFWGRRKILIADIYRIDEKNEDIKIMNYGITGETIFTGRKAILILKSGKKIKINSIAVGGYNMLITKLKKQWVKVMADALRHTANKSNQQ
jgi:hypothetical protein